MGRRSTFSDTDVFAAVAAVLSDGHLPAGQLPGIQPIAKAAGLSTGSLYHRFGSREGLLAEAWLHAVSIFQTRFREALHDNGLSAALTTPRFCRDEPRLAMILIAVDTKALLAGSLPAPLRDRIERINDAARSQVIDFAQRHQLSLELAQLALVHIPLTVVRMYLPARPVPEIADTYVANAYRGLIAPQTGV